MAVFSFTAYVLSDPSNKLDAEKAFVSLSYFNLMKIPLMWLPNFLSDLSQVIVSTKRINSYLGSAEVDPANVQREEKQDGR